MLAIRQLSASGARRVTSTAPGQAARIMSNRSLCRSLLIAQMRVRPDELVRPGETRPARSAPFRTRPHCRTGRKPSSSTKGGAFDHRSPDMRLQAN
eukprot:951918-Prymnesium_polylepis.1